MYFALQLSFCVQKENYFHKYQTLERKSTRQRTELLAKSLTFGYFLHHLKEIKSITYPGDTTTMNNRPAKFATLTAVAKDGHQLEIASGANVPVLMHNPNAGTGEPENKTVYAFTNAGKPESAVVGLQRGVWQEQHQDVSIGSGGKAKEDGEYFPNRASGSRNNSKQFFCRNCGKCYIAAGSLHLHLRTCMQQCPVVPPGKFKCHICHNFFDSISNLKEHMMLRHTDKSPRTCQRCFRKFYDEDKFKAHLAAEHAGRIVTMRESKCRFCSEKFRVVFDVNQVNHRYSCDACLGKYTKPEALKQHFQAKNDIRKFHCDRCGRKFYYEGYMHWHFRTCDGRRDLK